MTSANHIRCPQGGPCKFKLELQPASGVVIPAGFSYYAEWLGPDDEQTTTLRVVENVRQVPAGNNGVYIDVEISKEAPIGMYYPAHFEMRFGSGPSRRAKEISVDDISLPSIEVTEWVNPEVPWPTVKGWG